MEINAQYFREAAEFMVVQELDNGSFSATGDDIECIFIAQ